jgi:hypothetical protein
MGAIPSSTKPSLHMDLNILLKARRPLVDNAPPSQALLTNPNGRLRRSILPFFTLPREIRDLIYDFVFNGESFWFGHIESRVGASYAADGMLKSHNHWPPGFMFISKQFFSEGVEQFYRKASFHLEPDEKKSLTTQHYPGTLRVDRAQIIQLHIDVLCAFRSHRQESIRNMAETRYQILPANQTSRQLLRHTASASALRILDIAITFKGKEVFGDAYKRRPRLRKFDIKPLAQLLDQLPRKLEKVFVEVKMVDYCEDLSRYGLDALGDTLRPTVMGLVRLPRAIPQETIDVAKLDGKPWRFWKFRVTTLGYDRTKGEQQVCPIM